MGTTIQRVGGSHRLEAAQRLSRPIEAALPFFADAFNLESITPPTLQSRILTAGPLAMRAGAAIDHRLRLSGVPARWRSEITAWEPPFRFVDEQRRGLDRWWIHEHRFHEERDETVVPDRVDYGVPGGALVHRFLVRPALRRIFADRAACLQTRLGE
jgi:ligand-binding SRPBCC domain-containing protein